MKLEINKLQKQIKRYLKARYIESEGEMESYEVTEFNKWFDGWVVENAKEIEGFEDIEEAKDFYESLDDEDVLGGFGANY